MDNGTENSGDLRSRISSDSIHILHLEDNMEDRALVHAGLEREGIRCRIRSVATKEEFLSGIGEGQYDVIVSDSSLPSFTGSEALEIVRTRCPGIPFIVYSGMITEESRRAATAAVPKGRLSELAAVLKEVTRPRESDLDQILKGLQWPASAQSLVDILAVDRDLGLLVFDKDRRISAWSAEMERLYGLSLGEAMGRSLTDVFSDLGRNGEDLLLYSIVEGKSMTWKESSHIHRLKKTAMSTVVSYIPLWDAENAMAGGIILARDVTTYKRMVQAGMMVESAFRSAVEGAADAILMLDAGGKIRYANKKSCRMLGLPAEDLVSQSFSDLLSPDALRTWQATIPELQRALEVNFPLRVNGRKGCFFEVGASAALNQAGRIILILRDISDQVTEAADLRHSRDFFESLANSAEDVVLSVSADQRVNYVNPSFTMMTGWSKWIWLGRELASLIHPDDVRLWSYHRDATLAGSAGAGSMFRLRLRCADGKYSRGECKCSPVIQNGKVTGTWHIIRSVDEPFFPDETSAREFKVMSEEYVS